MFWRETQTESQMNDIYDTPNPNREADEREAEHPPTETKHTPLRVEDNRQRQCACFCILDEMNVTVAEVYDDSLAPLFASAPDLLAALETIANAYWTDGESERVRIDDLQDMARTAIAKATQ